jgi:hypothetical protein
MKKFLSLIVLTIILSGTLFSQDCLNDIYYTVVNQKAYGKARKKNGLPNSRNAAGSRAVIKVNFTRAITQPTKRFYRFLILWTSDFCKR